MLSQLPAEVNVEDTVKTQVGGGGVRGVRRVGRSEWRVFLADLGKGKGHTHVPNTRTRTLHHLQVLGLVRPPPPAGGASMMLMAPGGLAARGWNLTAAPVVWIAYTKYLDDSPTDVHDIKSIVSHQVAACSPAVRAGCSPPLAR
jgi:hypothetical protein